ncbi:MAG: hypothetical protein ACRYGK_03445 [Janthinobacterium lividum]
MDSARSSNSPLISPFDRTGNLHNASGSEEMHTQNPTELKAPPALTQRESARPAQQNTDTNDAQRVDIKASAPQVFALRARSLSMRYQMNAGKELLAPADHLTHEIQQVAALLALPENTGYGRMAVAARYGKLRVLQQEIDALPRNAEGEFDEAEQRQLDTSLTLAAQGQQQKAVELLLDQPSGMPILLKLEFYGQNLRSGCIDTQLQQWMRGQRATIGAVFPGSDASETGTVFTELTEVANLSRFLGNDRIPRARYWQEAALALATSSKMRHLLASTIVEQLEVLPASHYVEPLGITVPTEQQCRYFTSFVCQSAPTVRTLAADSANAAACYGPEGRAEVSEKNQSEIAAMADLVQRQAITLVATAAIELREFERRIVAFVHTLTIPMCGSKKVGAEACDLGLHEKLVECILHAGKVDKHGPASRRDVDARKRGSQHVDDTYRIAFALLADFNANGFVDNLLHGEAPLMQDFLQFQLQILYDCCVQIIQTPVRH